MAGSLKGRLAYRFALAASILAGCTLLLTMLASLWLVNYQQEEANKLLQRKEAQHNKRLLLSALKAITTRLTEAANSSLLANALVDSAGRQIYLTPYLNGMQAINGIPIKLIFTDFEGKQIASSGDSHFDQNQMTWLGKQLDTSKLDVAIFNGDKGDELLLTELMTYSRTQSAEGALMYKITISDLQDLISAKLIWGNTPNPSNQEALVLPVNDIPRLQHLNLRIVQEAMPDPSHSRFTSYLLIAMFALALAAVVLFVGLRIAPSLTRDLRELEDFSRRVVEDGFGAQRANIKGSVEVIGLAGSINHMLDRLNEQHRKLQAESEARYRLLVEGTNAISWEAALPDFVYSYVSPQGQTITAIKTEEWLTPGFWQAHIHPDDLPAMLEKRAQSIRAKHDYHVEYRFRRQNGAYVWLEEIAAVLIDARGRPASLRGILLDIDERKLAEQRLQEERSKLDRLKNDFVSTVSHELRTPLTSIRGSLGLILGGVTGQLNPQTSKLITIAHQNSERLVSLINDLLDIDKIVSGKMEFEWQWIELANVVDQAIESNQAYANQLGIQLVNISANQTPVQALVKIDVNRLLQVLANLLSNAAKFSPKGEKVEVKIEKSPQAVRVSVRDYGNGIPEEFRKKIFEKFSQADSSDTRAKGGTGLGLAISKVLIEQMGGQIGFESEIGVGTTFYFDLPL